VVIPDSTAAFRAIYDPGLNRSSQQCVRELNLPIAGDGVLGFHRSDQSVGDAAVVAEARPEGGPEPDREEQDRLESTAIN